MRQFTIDDIRSWNPCYDPSEKFNEVFTEQWSGTPLDLLKLDHIPAEDRLWAVLRKGIIDDRTLQLFAVWCARQALALIENTDPRSVSACDVAERYANGAATERELDAAVAADDAALAAAYAASASDAADAASYASDAASYAAYAAYAAYASDAASYASDASDASDAAYAAAREQQVEHLIQMLEL